jgi:hypothetical protein
VNFIVVKIYNNISAILTFSSNEIHNLRSASHKDIVIPKHRTNYGKKLLFLCNGAKKINRILYSIRSSNSLTSFKNQYKTYFADICFLHIYNRTVVGLKIYYAHLWVKYFNRRNLLKPMKFLLNMYNLTKK